MTCEGDHTQFCGGAGYLDMYISKAVNFVDGCLTDTARWKFSMQAYYFPSDAPEQWFGVKVINVEGDKWILSVSPLVVSLVMLLILLI